MGPEVTTEEAVRDLGHLWDWFVVSSVVLFTSLPVELRFHCLEANARSQCLYRQLFDSMGQGSFV